MGVTGHSTHASPSSEQVRCLSCRHVYSKPINGSTASRNPGCPVCGYVGWLSVLVPVAEPTASYLPTKTA
jgi:hypothetical protein